MSANTSGVIHDLGYRRYEGDRLGRISITRALFWHSLRSAFGIGRGARAKIVPVIVFGLMCMPAVINAVTVAVNPGHTRGISYDTYIFPLRLVLVAIFIAAQAPELVSRDLRSHVLPLYFSRPLRRLDYPLAKFAALTAACLAVIGVPLLLLYLGTIVSASGGSAIWAETRALIPGLLVGAMWAVLLAAIGIAIASFSGRRAYATGAIAVYFFLTFTLARILTGVVAERVGPPGTFASPSTGARLANLISPFTVLEGVRRWLGGTTPTRVPDPGSYGPLFGAMLLVLLAVSLGALFARYRKVGVA